MNTVRCPIVELRQYTLHPGQREALITLFDREFVESQEELGMVILGQFRDLDNPDRFVWLRGFETMPSRAKALASFYSGPAWKANSAAANATMIDSDNVLLLRPASARCGFPAPGITRPPAGHTESLASVILATIYYCDHPFDDEFLYFFDSRARPALGHSRSRAAGVPTDRIRQEHVSRAAGAHGRARVRVVRAVLQHGAGARV
jgi:quinol monooxygenase YgiN